MKPVTINNADYSFSSSVVDRCNGLKKLSKVEVSRISTSVFKGVGSAPNYTEEEKRAIISIVANTLYANGTRSSVAVAKEIKAHALIMEEMKKTPSLEEFSKLIKQPKGEVSPEVSQACVYMENEAYLDAIGKGQTLRTEKDFRMEKIVRVKNKTKIKPKEVAKEGLKVLRALSRPIKYARKAKLEMKAKLSKSKEEIESDKENAKIISERIDRSVKRRSDNLVRLRSAINPHNKKTPVYNRLLGVTSSMFAVTDPAYELAVHKAEEYYLMIKNNLSDQERENVDRIIAETKMKMYNKEAFADVDEAREM